MATPFVADLSGPALAMGAVFGWVVLVVEVTADVVLDVDVVLGRLVDVVVDDVEEVEVDVVVVLCRRAADAGTAIAITSTAAHQLRTIPRGKLILLWHLLLV